jgi:hypothetical protein
MFNIAGWHLFKHGIEHPHTGKPTLVFDLLNYPLDQLSVSLWRAIVEDENPTTRRARKKNCALCIGPPLDGDLDFPFRYGDICIAYRTNRYYI